MTLTTVEKFLSIQGESTYAGELCAFIRLAGCNLRCSWCDTIHSYEGGKKESIEEICQWAKDQGSPLVEITGGEPLLQSATVELCRALCDNGFTVLIETNGSLDISTLPKEVIRIVDIKTPDSGAAGSYLESNTRHLNSKDQLKFVIASREDYLWSKNLVLSENFPCRIIFSPVWDSVAPLNLAEWIIEDKLPVRLGIQLHKIIWGPDTQGV